MKTRKKININRLNLFLFAFFQGGVFFDLWVLSATVACYILVQQILRLIMNRFGARKDRPNYSGDLSFAHMNETLSVR